MGSESYINKILNLPWRIKQWWIESICNHEYFFEEIGKGWFTTGSLSFHVICTKCSKFQFIRMKFPPQVDRDENE